MLARLDCLVSRFAVAVCVSTLLLAAPRVAHAEPKDQEATKLYTQALEEDYLNVEFDAAVTKLQKAIALCGDAGCSKKVLGKLYIGLGTILSGGKGQHAQAKEAFIKALQIDPGATALQDYMTPDLERVFAEAKQEAGSATPAPVPGPVPVPPGPVPTPVPAPGGEEPRPAGDVPYDPPEEALVNTPLPIFIRVGEEIGVGDAKLRYKPFGGTQWQSVNMQRVGDGFGGIIPCRDLTTTGKVRFYIILKDNEGDQIASAGTLNSPHSVLIRNEIEGDQPNLPGKEPPKKCTGGPADCPPDFPGCGPGATPPAPGGQRGNKGWGATCDTTQECKEGYICLNGSCEQGDDGPVDDPKKPSSGGPKNFVSLNFQLDLLSIGGADDVCGVVKDGRFSQELDNYFCFHPEDGGEFLGKPADGRFNQIEGGMGLASGRILAGYDRILWEGLTIGTRIGVAIGGSPGLGDAQERFEACRAANSANPNVCREPLASEFLPLHWEIIRAQYTFTSDLHGIDWLYPYVFAGFGVGQVNAGVPVSVCDTVDDDGVLIVGPVDGRCPENTVRRDDIGAFQITGLNFIPFGIGSIFQVHEYVGISAELKFMAMLPTTGFVVAPTVAPVVMF